MEQLRKKVKTKLLHFILKTYLKLTTISKVSKYMVNFHTYKTLGNIIIKGLIKFENTSIFNWLNEEFWENNIAKKYFYSVKEYMNFDYLNERKSFAKAFLLNWDSFWASISIKIVNYYNYQCQFIKKLSQGKLVVRDSNLWYFLISAHSKTDRKISQPKRDHFKL